MVWVTCKNIKCRRSTKKSIIIKSVNRVCGKKMSKYIYWVKKKTCLGILNTRDRDKDDEAGVKRGGRIEISTTVLSIYAMHALHSLI